MGEKMNMTFSSSLTDICELNSSFDKGILRVCYTGDNRNGSSISKDTLTRCLPTMANVPVVCNYDRETDSLGGHDVELVTDNDGNMSIVNLTQPIGVVPESAKQWFDMYTDEDGMEHEYLYTEVLLWKRQEAYDKVKRDGITSHSMEINVSSGKNVDGIYHIEDFEFTAFALISVTPCYQSSALEVFSFESFKQQMSEMMQELKESFNEVTSPSGDDDIHPQKNSTEGGETALDEKMELAVQYCIDVDTLDFSLEDFTIEELTEKFEAMKTEKEFALENAIRESLTEALQAERIECDWCEGGYPKYIFEDYDKELGEVYGWDSETWVLYGWDYTINGDVASIDFGKCKRKKYVIADFDEGEQPSPFVEAYSMLKCKFDELSGKEAECVQLTEQLSAMECELDDLRTFKAEADKSAADAARAEVFAQFEDLVGIDAFEELKSNSEEFAIEDIEEKCFAIRGRFGTTAKTFSLEKQAPKLKVAGMNKSSESTEPYGGLFVKYQVGQE